MNTAMYREKPRIRPRYVAALFALFGGAFASACTFDSSDRCGPNQVIFGDNLRCVCDTHSAYTATGCVRCGEHEVAGPSGCVCEPNFSKGTGGVCEPTPMGIGVPCDGTCEDPVYKHCETTASGGYCTNTGCTGPADCTGGYACDTATGVCKRPPIGLAKSCTSNADCAGTEATYCDTFVTHSCLVQGCTLAPDNCFQGWECCDLSSFGIPQPLCVLAGACTT
ncbi:MAG TPA: hypothetical protein VFQ35_17720 [Polyangiaceae bacterium]|nr:hypothetical protein [Polyangiaceae bacterium]